MYFFPRLWRIYALILPCVLVMVLCALCVARTLPIAPNPYRAYVELNAESVRALATCYADFDDFSYTARGYCSLRRTGEYVTWQYDEDGALTSVGFWRLAEKPRLGDFIAWYGAPSSYRRMRVSHCLTWRLSEPLIFVCANSDNLYAVVSFVVFMWR